MSRQAQYAPVCPYCGDKAQFTASHSNFRGKGGWLCVNYPACDSYVGVHPHTQRPLGSMADRSLRQERVRVHQCIDHYWRGQKASLKRSHVYAVIAQVIGEPFHVGQAREGQIRQFFAALPAINRVLRRDQKAVGDAKASTDQQTLRSALHLVQGLIQMPSGHKASHAF